MSTKISHIEPGSFAERLDWQVGDEVVRINGERIADEIDFRFHAAESVLNVELRRNGILKKQRVEREENEPFGVRLEEFVIRPCADDCIFCFVDQNPAGLREALYFRDSDPRMSFLYGNYITVTNLREADLERIVSQRLSPMYISVHATDDQVRRRLMGHRKQRDDLMEKLEYFRAHGIDMHTQIVLVPEHNDGEVLERTIEELYRMNDAIQSVSVVPVGLTGHRQGLARLRTVTPEEARTLIDDLTKRHRQFSEEIGRGFVYASDEMYLLAGRPFPNEDFYDGFPLMENGVGMCRDFLNEFDFQLEEIPPGDASGLKVTMVTGSLAYALLADEIAPRLAERSGATIEVVRAENRLFGPPVTVSGLLGYRCLQQALSGRDLGDMILLPPDCVNFEGDFLDNVPGQNRPEDLERELGVPVQVFSGDWVEAVRRDLVYH